MAVYSSPEAAMSGITGCYTVNVGGGDFTQDTAGTIAASDPVAGTFTTGNATANIKDMRRDLIRVNGISDAAPSQFMETRVYLPNGPPWSGGYSNGLLIGWCIFRGGTADANLIGGWGIWCDPAQALRERYMYWNSTGVPQPGGGVYVSYSYDGEMDTAQGFTGWGYWNHGELRGACFNKMSGPGALQNDKQRNADFANGYAPMAGLGGSDWYAGTVVGLTTAGGPFALNCVSQIAPRELPRDTWAPG